MEEQSQPAIINTYVILTLNNYSGLQKCVESMYEHTPHNFRVIVVHNGKDVETYNKVKEALGDKVHIWLDSYKNLGFAKGMNQGIKLSETEYVTILNDDVEFVYDTWWDDVMNEFATRENLVGFNPHSPCNKNMYGDRVKQYDHSETGYTPEQVEEIKEIFKNERWYPGCCTYCTIIKRSIFDEIGLLDESFGQGSGEDYDFNIRIARAGKVIGGGSSAIVWHWWGNTKDNMPKEEFSSGYDLIMKGNQRLTEKWGNHIDKDPEGWSVNGQGGPLEPYDKDTANYEAPGKWWVEEPL